MKVSYVECLANNNGPESCVYDRKVVYEALTGECTGRVLSRESEFRPGCRRCRNNRKATRNTALSRGVFWLCVVGDPVHVLKPFAREPGGPTTGPDLTATGTALRIPRENGSDVWLGEVGQTHMYRRNSRTKAGGIPAGGDCGGKGSGQGESVPTKQVLGTVPERERL